MGHRDHPATKSHFANSNPMQSMAPFCFTDAISTHFGHFARQRDETIPECRNIFPTFFQRGKCSSLNCRVTGRRELNFVNFVNFSHGRGCASLSFRFQLLPLRGKKSNIQKKKLCKLIEKIFLNKIVWPTSGFDSRGRQSNRKRGILGNEKCP